MEKKSTKEFVPQNFKLTLEYDGASFFGFQRQPGRPSVQEEIEKALSRLFNQPVKIGSASGRTDTGVHAEGQVIHFFAPFNLREDQILQGLNCYLPKSIAVKLVEKVSKSFHSRYDAKRKTYRYQIWNHPVRSPLHAAQAVHIPYKLDLEAMKKGAKILCGRHDFKSFCAVNPKQKSKETVRTVFEIKLKKQGPLLQFTFEADGFLHHMIRNLMGTLVDLGRGKFTLKGLKIILESRDRTKARETSPAHGLCLMHVTY